MTWVRPCFLFKTTKKVAPFYNMGLMKYKYWFFGKGAWFELFRINILAWSENNYHGVETILKVLLIYYLTDYMNRSSYFAWGNVH